MSRYHSTQRRWQKVLQKPALNGMFEIVTWSSRAYLQNANLRTNWIFVSHWLRTLFCSGDQGGAPKSWHPLHTVGIILLLQSLPRTTRRTDPIAADRLSTIMLFRLQRNGNASDGKFVLKWCSSQSGEYTAYTVESMYIIINVPSIIYIFVYA